MPPRPRVSEGQASARISRMHVTLEQHESKKTELYQVYQVLGPGSALAMDFKDRPWFTRRDKQVAQERIPEKLN